MVDDFFIGQIAIRLAYLAAHLGAGFDAKVENVQSRKSGGNRRLTYHIDGNKCKLSLEAPPDVIQKIEAELDRVSISVLREGQQPVDVGLDQVGTGEPDPG